jgi:hypothetical protein
MTQGHNRLTTSDPVIKVNDRDEMKNDWAYLCGHSSLDT